jgi:hypothetical protein
MCDYKSMGYQSLSPKFPPPKRNGSRKMGEALSSRVSGRRQKCHEAVQCSAQGLLGKEVSSSPLISYLYPISHQARLLRRTENEGGQIVGSPTTAVGDFLLTSSRSLAWAEMRMILAYMLWHFDLELHPVSKYWMDRQKVFMLWQKPYLMVEMSPRPQMKCTA